MEMICPASAAKYHISFAWAVFPLVMRFGLISSLGNLGVMSVVGVSSMVAVGTMTVGEISAVRVYVGRSVAVGKGVLVGGGTVETAAAGCPDVLEQAPRTKAIITMEVRKRFVFMRSPFFLDDLISN
jgi:hypothetical protein